jgi:hypothetical protein
VIALEELPPKNGLCKIFILQCVVLGKQEDWQWDVVQVLQSQRVLRLYEAVKVATMFFFFYVLAKEFKKKNQS